MNANVQNQRASKRKPIISADEVKWEVVYGTAPEKAQEAIDEVLEILTIFGVNKGYLGTDILDENQKEKLTSKSA